MRAVAVVVPAACHVARGITLTVAQVARRAAPTAIHGRRWRAPWRFCTVAVVVPAAYYVACWVAVAVAQVVWVASVGAPRCRR